MPIIWALLAALVMVAGLVATGFPRLNRARQPGPGGLETTGVTQAYDRISRSPQFKVIRRMVVGELRNYRPTGTLVDLGCGPGYLIAVMARAFPQLNIVGVDISQEMLRMAARNLTALGFGRRVEFRPGDGQRLPFEDGTVDFVVSTLSLHHWQEPRQVFREVHRVLRPGGEFLVFDIRRDSRRFVYWLLLFAQRFMMPAAMRQMNEPAGSLLSAYKPGEIEAMLASIAGGRWHLKGGAGWMFIWGRRARPGAT